MCARCCVLQADSERLKQLWLGALQGSIDLAYRGGPASCRSLGVHLSKVRSLTLDSWEPE